jgi:hypothetical protein
VAPLMYASVTTALVSTASLRLASSRFTLAMLAPVKSAPARYQDQPWDGIAEMLVMLGSTSLSR